MTAAAPPNPTDTSPEAKRSTAVWPSRRTFYAGLTVVCALALTIAAAQANQAFLLLGALLVAIAVDGFEPLSATWVGWHRSVDSRRLIVFAASFVVALVVLAGVVFTLENQFSISGT